VAHQPPEGGGAGDTLTHSGLTRPARPAHRERHRGGPLERFLTPAANKTREPPSTAGGHRSNLEKARLGTMPHQRDGPAIEQRGWPIGPGSQDSWPGCRRPVKTGSADVDTVAAGPCGEVRRSRSGRRLLHLPLRSADRSRPPGKAWRERRDRLTMAPGPIAGPARETSWNPLLPTAPTNRGW
jgi:hypothetical protein